MEGKRTPPLPLELVCEPCADYVPWKDDVPEIRGRVNKPPAPDGRVCLWIIISVLLLDFLTA